VIPQSAILQLPPFSARAPGILLTTPTLLVLPLIVAAHQHIALHRLSLASDSAPKFCSGSRQTHSRQGATPWSAQPLNLAKPQHSRCRTAYRRRQRHSGIDHNSSRASTRPSIASAATPAPEKGTVITARHTLPPPMHCHPFDLRRSANSFAQLLRGLRRPPRIPRPNQHLLTRLRPAIGQPEPSAPVPPNIAILRAMIIRSDLSPLASLSAAQYGTSKNFTDDNPLLSRLWEFRKALASFPPA